MKLIYCGPAREPGAIVALPEGWPACGHDEPDEALAKEKVASGNYRLDGPLKSRGQQPAGGEE